MPVELHDGLSKCRSCGQSREELTGACPKHVALALMRAGYRVTSRKHRLVSRVDREDWRTVLDSDHLSADFYRRVHSYDKLVVPESVRGHMLNSSHDRTGFVHGVNLTELKALLFKVVIPYA